MIIGLFFMLVLVLVLPFSIKKIEEQLELFLFIMGAVTVTLTSQWTGKLIAGSLMEPLKITIAVFFAGLAFKFLQKPIDKNLGRIIKFTGIRLFVFIVVAGLGLLSSVITAIIAALILVEIISYMRMDRKNEIKIVIITCFSIGIGAALTPIGEPLSALAIGKLKGGPYNADFWFLCRVLGLHIISGVILLGLIAVYMLKSYKQSEYSLREKERENIKSISIRTAKIYFFILGLYLLGTGFKPLIDIYISRISPYALYWINTASAALDNATLTAAEIAPSMTIKQIQSAILGLIIAGGMLIPGNIPNIIAAEKLGIKSKEWAKYGVPIGLIVMAVYFVILILIP